jgi:hypothetical protein
MTFLRLFFCTIATGLLLPVTVGLASNPPASTNKVAGAVGEDLMDMFETHIISKGRPANFYKAGYFRDGSNELCETVIEALNEPHHMPMGWGTSRTIQPWMEALIGNKYEVEWKELDGRAGWVNSGTLVDIDNDGEVETVYRSDFSFKSLRWIILTYSDDTSDIYTGPEYFKDVWRWEKLSKKQLKQINSDIGPHNNGTPFRWIARDQLKIDFGDYPDQPIYNWAEYGQFATVLYVNFKYYVLVGGSHDRALKIHPVPLRLFQVIDKQPKLLCEFKARYR